MNTPLIELRIEADDYAAIRLKILTLTDAHKDGHTMREVLSIPLDLRALLKLVERAR